jgi:hypothetical protein
MPTISWAHESAPWLTADREPGRDTVSQDGPRDEGSWAVRVLITGLGLLAVFPTIVGAQVLANPVSWRWGQVLGYCLPCLGGILGVLVGRRVKGPERRRAEAAVNRAVWTGELPQGADPREWRYKIRQQVNGATVGVIALLVLGVGGGALTAVAAATARHDAGGVWALAVAQEITAVGLIWACVRVVRNGRRTLTGLRTGS